MATAESVKAKLQGLIDTANATTGNADADLTAAVNALVEGFGQGGGDTSSEDAILGGTIESYYNDRLTTVRSGAFSNCNTLKTLDLPNVEQAGDSAFAQLTAIETLNLPKLTSVGAECFWNLPLKTVVLPNLEKSTGLYAFRGAQITEIVLPKYNHANGRSFYGCNLLGKADLYVQSAIDINFFSGCSALTTLILRKADAIVTLYAASAAYVGDPIHDGTGYIYVPSAFLDEYKVATNWSTYADQFRAIEDYPDICGVSA